MLTNRVFPFLSVSSGVSRRGYAFKAAFKSDTPKQQESSPGPQGQTSLATQAAKPVRSTYTKTSYTKPATSSYTRVTKATIPAAKAAPVTTEDASTNNTTEASAKSTLNSALNAKTFNQTFTKSLHDTPVMPDETAKSKSGFLNGIEPLSPEALQQSNSVDWINSFHGIGTTFLNQRQVELLLQPLDPEDIEMKPDGLIYLPEIKYRRILNRALGPGAWGLIPRSETIITPKLITREYALVVMGKLVSVARGEQDYFNEQGIPTATEGCKSNALMRCCKDLGIGSELWDPRFIRKFKKQYCEEKFVTHVVTGKKKRIWKRKDDPVDYPYKL